MPYLVYNSPIKKNTTPHYRLVSTVAEVVRRGAIPFVLGGSSELCAGVAAGLMSAVGGVMGVVNINSQLDVRDQLVRTLVQYIAFGFTF